MFVLKRKAERDLLNVTQIGQGNNLHTRTRHFTDLFLSVALWLALSF